MNFSPGRSRWSMLSSLQARLLLLILIIFVPVLILSLYTVSQQREFATRKAQQDAWRLAQLAAKNQEQLIVSAQQLLTALAQIPAVKDGVTPACDSLFAGMLTQFENYTNIFMVNAGGDTICTGIPLTAPLNVAERLWFRRAMQRGTFSVADFEFGALTKRPVVTLSLPIFDDQNRIKYQLGLALDLRKVSGLITDSALPPNTTITAIDRNGIVLYRYPQDENLIGKNYAHNPIVQAALKNHEGSLEGPGLDDLSERLFGFLPLDRTNGSAYIIVGVDKANAYADANLLLLQNLFGLGMVILITLMTALIGVRRLVVHPMRLLVTNTQQLAAGDLKVRLNAYQVPQSNELRALAEAFNQMAAALAERQQALEHSNTILAAEIVERKNIEAQLENARDGLEQIVQERTAELLFLAEASKILASEMDYHITLQQVAHLAVPALATGCVIELLEGSAINTIAAVHHQPAYSPELALQLSQSTDANHQPTTISRQIIQNGQPLLLQSVTADETIIMGAPIMIQDKVAGAIVLELSASSSHTNPPSNMNLVEEIARRIAVAVDNTRLYRQVYEQREHLLVTLASIGDGVIATDKVGIVTFINAIAQALTGWTETDAIGKHLNEIFQITNESSGQTAENPALQAITEGRIISLSNHTTLIARNGIKRPIDDSGAPIWDENRKILGAILVFRDITERRQRELAEQEQRLLSEALRDTALTLTSTLNLSEVLDRILANVGQVVPHNTADVMFIEAGNARIVRSRGYSEWGINTTNTVFAVAHTATLRQMLATRQPIVIPDVQSYPEWIQKPESQWIRSYVGVPILLQDEIIGFLNLTSTTVDFFTPVQADHLQAFAAQAAIAIQNAQLFEQAQTLAAIEERQRLAYDLHDAVSQMLFSSSLLAESLPRLWKRSPEKVENQLEQLHRLNRGAHAELRNLLMELSPKNMVKTNFNELFKQLALATNVRTKLNVNVQVTGQQLFPPEVHIALYRITQEALNNVIKHAHATQVDITLVTQQRQTILTIKDNGRGFNVSQNSSKSMGLNIMRERARTIGAKINIHSQVGQGTEIVATWPQP